MGRRGAEVDVSGGQREGTKKGKLPSLRVCKPSSNPSAQEFAQGESAPGRGRIPAPVPKTKGDQRHQEVLWAEGAVAGAPSANRRSSGRFQGKNG